MTEPVDYFTNHRNKMRFPWSLYHRPIVAALDAVIRSTSGTRLLNIGSGPFFEAHDLHLDGKAVSLCDIDARAIEVARELHGHRVRDYAVILPGDPLPYPDASFDLVVSMDVIEHVPEPGCWLEEALRVLQPTGTLFLTTPNYASSSLRLLEATALEIIARRQGFSRKALHPSKMTRERLAQLLARAGCRHIDVAAISFGWVLAATARKG